jgi:tetratricopeptide (TPR) repeat protein
MRVPRHSQRRRNVAIGAVAAALALAGGAVAALVGIGGGDGGATSAAHRTSSTSTTSSTTTTATAHPNVAEGAALDTQGFALMQAGNYEAALPILTRAVHALYGSRTLDEAYADYNLAYTRFALGRCDGVLQLLDRSEGIQGSRGAIRELRAQAERRCVEGKTGKGKGKGHGNGDEG